MYGKQLARTELTFQNSLVEWQGRVVECALITERGLMSTFYMESSTELQKVFGVYCFMVLPLFVTIPMHISRISLIFSQESACATSTNRSTEFSHFSSTKHMVNFLIMSNIA